MSTLRTPFGYWRDWMHPLRTIDEHRAACRYERAMSLGVTREERAAYHRQLAKNAPHVRADDLLRKRRAKGGDQ